jgi:hypothetical protein
LLALLIRWKMRPRRSLWGTPKIGVPAIHPTWSQWGASRVGAFASRTTVSGGTLRHRRCVNVMAAQNVQRTFRKSVHERCIYLSSLT